VRRESNSLDDQHENMKSQTISPEESCWSSQETKSVPDTHSQQRLQIDDGNCLRRRYLHGNIGIALPLLHRCNLQPIETTVRSGRANFIFVFRKWDRGKMLPMPSSKPCVTMGYKTNRSLMRVGFVTFRSL
jgi:hypothetical protein